MGVSSTHQLQSSRFELKYIIDENCARALREFASGYLVPDENAVEKPNCEYPVHSLYLDSVDLALCRSTMTGEKNRFKLRIRFYDDRPESPVFFEIKRRQDRVILKQRAAVHREAGERLLAGHWPRLSDLIKPSANALGALERFCSLRNLIRAEGRVFVSYMREAYVSPNDNSVRLTFDRNLSGCRYEGKLCLSDSGAWIKPEVGGVVLEMKFTDRFPIWMREMVRAYNLDRCSMAKYVTCAQGLLSTQWLLMQGYKEIKL